MSVYRSLQRNAQQSADAAGMRAGPFLKENEIRVPSYVYFPKFNSRFNAGLKQFGDFHFVRIDQEWALTVKPDEAQAKLEQVRAYYFREWKFPNLDQPQVSAKEHGQ
ncbi:MAG: hypothetical protein HZB51_34370 [Chloroflexi bacterium]|nr:hypothetical protein [Chloroflexota bacterium]